MSKRKPESPSDSGREGEEEDDDEKYKKRQRIEALRQHVFPAEYQFDNPGPSHRSYSAQPESSILFEEPRRLQHLPPMHTRGPGRPRIHPPKPAGISRPRGRPKGSKNKKPRKRIERPPKRPRGRPRKWPPEMWEGFQRTREAAVQQQIKQQQQMKQHQPTPPAHEMPGTSHMFLEAHQLESAMQMQSGIPHHMQPQHPHFPPPPPQQEQEPSRVPLYMQMPLETEQPQEFSLVMPPQTLPQELVHHHHHHHHPHPQQHMLSPLLLHGEGTREHRTEVASEPEELLWMQQLPTEEIPTPAHTTS